MGRIVEHKESDWIGEVSQIQKVSDGRTLILIASFLAQNKDTKNILCLHLFLLIILLVKMFKSLSENHLFDFKLFSRRDVRFYWHEVLLLLYGVYAEFGVKYKCTAKYRGYPAKSLRNISNSIVHVQIWTFTVNSAWVDKFAEPLNEVFDLKGFLQMARNRFIVAMLVVADDVCDEIHDFFVLFGDLL